MSEVDAYCRELDRLKYVSNPTVSMLSEGALRGKAVVDAARLRDVSDPEFYTIVFRDPRGRRIVLGPGTGANEP